MKFLLVWGLLLMAVLIAALALSRGGEERTGAGGASVTTPVGAHFVLLP